MKKLARYILITGVVFTSSFAETKNSSLDKVVEKASMYKPLNKNKKENSLSVHIKCRAALLRLQFDDVIDKKMSKKKEDRYISACVSRLLKYAKKEDDKDYRKKALKLTRRDSN